VVGDVEAQPVGHRLVQQDADSADVAEILFKRVEEGRAASRLRYLSH
jgi:hypothetical protein